MSRLIDADALRDKLHKLASDDWNQMCQTFWANVYNECADMVDEQPTIETQKWISCSDRLPNKTVLCCDKRGEMIIGMPYKDEESNTEFSAESEAEYMIDCIAWMPLPEAYKEEKE